MPIRRCWSGIAVLAGWLGCATQERPPRGTRLATVDVVDAVIAPGNEMHEVWDTLGTVPDDVWTGLESALAAADPYAAVIDFLATEADRFPKPDPFGTATLLSPYSSEDGHAHELAAKDDNPEDTFTPMWPSPGHWEGVPLTSELRIAVDLSDEDLALDDPIALVGLTAQHIDDAITAGQVVHVRPTGEGNTQVLFVGVLARETGVTR